MAEKHWLDAIIEKYGDSGTAAHSTGSYEWKNGGNGTDSDGDGKIEFDCSHFLNQVLKDMGYDNPYQSSSALKSSNYYDGINEADLQKGDIVLFNGHVGFFYGYDANGNMLVYSSSGSVRTGTDRGPAITLAKEWFGTPTKFLRPNPSPQPLLPTRPKTSATITRRDPLMMDLDGDGVINTLGTDAGIHFDHDGNDFKELSGWVAPGDGMLMLDRNVSGTLDNGSELFGDFTPLANGMLAVNGFQALAQFDTNGDGKIDASDPIWSQLKVWQHDPEATDIGDPDSSGIMKTLDEIGIKAIYLDSTITNRTDESGNTETRTGSFEWTNGNSGAISEYRLQRDTSNAIASEYLEVPADIATLPDLQGYGNVYSLHQAMVRDTSGQLKALVESFIAETNPANRASILEQIIYKWTGADTVAPDARGPFMDGRQVFVLEKFYGDSPQNPDAGLATAWKQTYQEITGIFYSSLMSQTHLKGLFDTINYSFDENTLTIKGDLSSAITELQSRLSSDSAQGQQDLGEFARTLRGMKMQERVDYLSFRETFIQMNPELGWIIDSAGLPVYDRVHQGQRAWSPHMEGTDNADAVKGSLTEGDGAINGLLGNDVIYGTARDEMLINETGNATMVAGGGNDTIWAGEFFVLEGLEYVNLTSH